ncbi:hypothetical protein N7523_005590, partial [Penicillium sp. IBT 18751x]
MPYQILKILMLHGHQQSAPIFEPKTYWIQRAFHQFASDRDVSFEFQFLSGKLPAYPDREEECDQWVWGYGDPRHGEIKKIEQSIQHILDTLDRDGPFAGIVGFSSGAAMAAIIASLLEKQGTIPNYPWKVTFPLDLYGHTAIQSAKLKFVICLSGFRLGSAYDAIYQPAISTPTLAAIGSRDPVISPVQTRLLADQCQNAKLFEFSGTHYVPQREEFPAFCRVLGDFLEDVLYPSQIEQAK